MAPKSKLLCGLASALLFTGVARSSSADLVLHYDFNGNVNDSSGNGYNGTVTGTTSYDNNQAFVFDGNTTIASTSATNLGLSQQSFTINAVIKLDPTGPTSGEAIFGAGTVGNNGDSNLLQFLVRNSAYVGFGWNDLSGIQVLATNTWYNLTFVYDQSTQTQLIYVNGILDASQGGHPEFNGDGTTGVVGTACCGTPDFKGEMDDFKVFNTALSAQQVAALVPEPASIGLISLGAIGALMRRRRNASI